MSPDVAQLPAAPAASVVSDAEVAYRRVVRALRTRKRYRYVRPEVRPQGEGFLVVSPCCSRNVEPDGGIIEIAWLERAGEAWRLHFRDHATRRWAQRAEGTLPMLLDVLCVDPERVFWP